MMAERTPDVGDASWPRGLAEATRLGSEESAAAQAALVRRQGQFARAVASMLTRLRALFEAAAVAFNAASPAAPVTLGALKGAGFTVGCGARRLSVLPSGDGNVIFTFSHPPKVDLVVLVARAAGDEVHWAPYRKHRDEDRFEPMPREPGDPAEVVTRQLFARLVTPSRSRLPPDRR